MRRGEKEREKRLGKGMNRMNGLHREAEASCQLLLVESSRRVSASASPILQTQEKTGRASL